ncbi:serine hydrolase domain-containing protein [soil metagenome]
MKRLITLLLFALILTPLTAQSPNPKVDAVRQRMQKFVDAGEISGAVVMAGGRDGVLFQEAIGLADITTNTPMKTDTIFRIASMTKPITCMGIMILAGEGKLTPDDPVEKYLPEFKGQMLITARDKDNKDKVTLGTPERPITLRDLMTHTSGLNGTYGKDFPDVYTKRQFTLAETTAGIAKQPLQFAPGSKWSYCNPGIDTLGRVIEVVSGMSYDTFLKKRIFDALQMQDTTPYPTAGQLARTAITYAKTEGKLVPAKNTLIDYVKDAKHPIPAGGLYSTAGNLAKLCTCLLNQGRSGDIQVLGRMSLAAMTKTQTGDIKTGFTDGMSYGYGFAVVKEPQGVTAMLSPGTFGHGGAFGTQYWIDPKQNLYMILLIQRSNLGNSDGSEIRKEFQRLAVEAVKK